MGEAEESTTDYVQRQSNWENIWSIPFTWLMRNWGPEKTFSCPGHKGSPGLLAYLSSSTVCLRPDSFLGSSKEFSARRWYSARSLGFSQELVFVIRCKKGEVVIKRLYLGFEFTAGSQELDTISLACPVDMKGGCGCHTWEPPKTQLASPMLARAQKMENKLTVQEEMSRGALAAKGWV